MINDFCSYVFKIIQTLKAGDLIGCYYLSTFLKTYLKYRNKKGSEKINNLLAGTF